MAPANLKRKADVLPSTNETVKKAHGLQLLGDIPAAKAKTHLLELLNDVDALGSEFVITKRGRPMARLVPTEDRNPPSVYGCMKGTFEITGDIVSPEPDEWERLL